MLNTYVMNPDIYGCTSGFCIKYWLNQATFHPPSNLNVTLYTPTRTIVPSVNKATGVNPYTFIYSEPH